MGKGGSRAIYGMGVVCGVLVGRLSGRMKWKEQDRTRHGVKILRVECAGSRRCAMMLCVDRVLTARSELRCFVSAFQMGWSLAVTLAGDGASGR